MNTFRELVLNNLKTGLYDISSTNGYTNTIQTVYDKLISVDTIKSENSPCVCILMGESKPTSFTESHKNVNMLMDVTILVHSKDNSGTTKESIIADLKKYFLLSELVSSTKTSTLNGLTDIQYYHTNNEYSAVLNELIGWDCGLIVTIEYKDNIRNLTEPVVPTLNLPISGSIYSGSLYPQHDWSSSTGSLSYHIQVSTEESFNTKTINVNNIQDSSFTVPYDYTLTNTKYYWRVRGNNITGHGEWSSIYNYTIS